jgi:hypothetical protein
MEARKDRKGRTKGYERKDGRKEGRKEVKKEGRVCKEGHVRKDTK